MKQRIITLLGENINNIFNIFFALWFLMSSYFLFPIPQVISLSRNMGIFSYIIIYYVLILLFFMAIFFSKKASIYVSLSAFIILNIALVVLLNKVRVVNISDSLDSIIRLVASFASLAFIRHARKVKHTLKMRKDRREMNQILIYPFDIRKKIANGTYRHITSDEDFWTKVQDNTADMEYICSFCILFFVFLIPDEALPFSTIFLYPLTYFRLFKHKWVLVDKDGKVI